MKKLIVSLMIVLSTQSFAIDLTLSPIYTAVDLIRSALATVVAPFQSTSASFVQKEQLEAIKADAINFLADDSVQSDALADSIKLIKTKSEELNSMSDKQIAGLIITALQ